MKIESLTVFCDLAETKSFTKAAQINQVTQSAVSQTISALERRFKSLLIERSKKNFRLTQEGEVVYDYFKQILQSFDALQNKLQEIEGVISGNIRVATVYTLGLHLLPPCVKCFLKSSPGVNVHVEYRRANQVYESVLGNVVDLGLVAYPVRDLKLETILLRKDKLALICHPQHPFAKRKSIRIGALNGQKFISFERNLPTREALDKIFKSHRVTVDQVMEMDNVETLKRAVEIDSGIAIVPQETVEQEVATGTLAVVQIEGGHFFRPLALIYKKNRVLSSAIKQFITLLKESL
ncbi:MAG: LysR family transcriptional regulator [Verrucomicrobiota bacterium]|jgi:DNA-binding transcriptional LysR family regulator